MKKGILVLIVAAVAGVVAYNYTTTGKITLIPGGGLSEEERELASLERQLRAAEKMFAQAGRAAGIAGVDTTADAEAALREVGMVERRLKEMKDRSPSEELRAGIDRLEAEVAEVKRKMGAS